MKANKLFSECLALPKDSPQHKQLREDLWLVGAAHACRYYLSIILNRDWETTEGTLRQRRLSKEEQGMILLVQHPEWTDEQIRETVNTTKKQMQRWGRFNAARSAQKHYKNGIMGWC